MKTPLLELYYFDTCPYCQKVLRVIHQLKLKVELIDIHDGINNLQKLMYITGKKTGPCLFINGTPMHESSDIVNWLQENVATLEKAQ